MSIMTWTRSAKCKDCKFLKLDFIGKRKISKCDNPVSEHYRLQITLNDLVCDNWKL